MGPVIKAVQSEQDYWKDDLNIKLFVDILSNYVENDYFSATMSQR